MGSGLTIRNWRIWAVAGGGAVCGALALAIFSVSIPSYHKSAADERHQMMTRIEPESLRSTEPAQPLVSDKLVAPPAEGSVQNAAPSQEVYGYYANEASRAPAAAKAGIIGGSMPAPAGAPLIARTASLTIQVKNLDAARSGMDAILVLHHGYSAELAISEEAQPRGLQGSLRIPAAEVDSAIAEMRTLGTVQREKQSGEEVTQQHTDLVARLANARETESRLRDILANRTGKMEDVLDVEDKISETRGEIEQLEAEQENLEHRFNFASVDLELVEQYEARLGNPSTSISNQMRNSLIAGLHHAGGSLFGVVLFFEEFGPVLLLWLVLLGVPGALLWRRYSKARGESGLRL
jgi:hypothetical protein